MTHAPPRQQKPSTLRKQQQQQRVGRVERRRRGGGALVAHAGVGADDEGVAEGDGLHLGVGGRRSG